MVPALAFLVQHRNELGVSAPWEYFWLTGSLSSFLDNAPTYLTFAILAAGGTDLGTLSQQQPLILQAISCGAVFMGANTYIGNGPNFMVKAIADEAGYRMPSFFGYMAYAACILLPVFALVTWLFFVE
jgi:Na+/H+ antiporter NhaD/arsenite permease-like protein